MPDKPTLGEIAQADHGILMSKAYTHMLMENSDSVLQQRGRDMRLYDELVEMMKEPPADEAVEMVSNASFFGRLMGLVSGGNSRLKD